MNKRVFNALRKVAGAINSEVGGKPARELDRSAVLHQPGRWITGDINHQITQNHIDELRNRFGEGYSQYLPIFDRNNPEGAKRAYQALRQSGSSVAALRDLHGGLKWTKPRTPALDYYRSTPAERKPFFPMPTPEPAQ